MIIPYNELENHVLHSLLEEIVTRDGTDYGEQEHSTEQKVKRVITLLQEKAIFIVYSELHETCSLMNREQLNQ